ncbi:MAG: allantoinase AllB [Bacteroidetes bacterium]|nr:allantoinase AllB [Bacteroidota bacterium]
MKNKFAIHSNRTITPSGIIEATVMIEDGIISNVIPGKASVSMNLVEAGDSVLMPGLIDSHVHINEPGRTGWEGFETATRSAAAGGITSLVDMPLNSSPVTTNVNSFREKITAANDKLYVNCGFWGGIIPGNEHDIQPLFDAGVLGFKIFLAHSGIDDFPNVSQNDLEKIAPLLSLKNIPLLVHAELESPHEGQLKFKENPKSYRAFLGSRPKSWEDEAIRMMIVLCEKYKLRIHIVHLSSSSSIQQLEAARKKGLPLTVETCPHYLFFDAESIPDADTRYKCAPPIREKVNNEKLLHALKDGIIDFVITDHSPAPPALKKIETGNLFEAWGGISSLQFSLPVMWTLFRKNNFSLEDLSRLMSSRIAKFLSLENSKGKIEKGFDADLVTWNPDKKFMLQKEMILHRHKITPYEGSELYGVTEQTYVNGELVYDRGSFVSSPKGKIILRHS